MWIMVPAALVDTRHCASCGRCSAAGDILIDGGNSHYQDDIRRAEELRPAGLHYVDAGTSGGVLGLEQGYCLMIGAEPEVFGALEPIFATLSPGGRRAEAHGRQAAPLKRMAEMGYLHCGPNGAGHFVKMVHNGIEYGVMAAYAEGLNLLRHADAGLEHARRRMPRPRRSPTRASSSTDSTSPRSPKSGGTAASSPRACSI